MYLLRFFESVLVVYVLELMSRCAKATYTALKYLVF